MAVFLEMLSRFDGALNLVGNVREASLIHDHVLESLAGEPWLKAAGHVLDVGSGNGFPIVPLLVRLPGLRATLLEPRERRWVFLREVVRELQLNAEVARRRLEEVHDCEFDAMTVRGVSPKIWRDRAVEVLRPGGVVVWWRGLGSGEEPFSMERNVIVSDLPCRRRGRLVVWSPCST